MLGLSIGFLAGLVLAWWWSRGVPPEQQTVCILNCFDGEKNVEMRLVCLTTQSDRCERVLQKRCHGSDFDPDPVPQ